jgi:maleylpyruvate isomerase
MRPDELVDTCRAAHRRLIANLAPLVDADIRRPSRLPGYSRGHLLTHLANKADAHVALFAGVAAGGTPRLHPPGYDPDTAAAAGAGRSATALRAALAASFERLGSAWGRLPRDRWDRPAIMTAGPRTMTEVVGHHLRNVEVHHVDLDIGYRVSDWPEAFVEGELAKRLRGLPDRAVHADLLAWLLDRASAPELVGPW